MKILQIYGGTEWCADPCAALVDPSYYDEYQQILGSRYLCDIISEEK